MPLGRFVHRHLPGKRSEKESVSSSLMVGDSNFLKYYLQLYNILKEMDFPPICVTE